MAFHTVVSKLNGTTSGVPLAIFRIAFGVLLLCDVLVERGWAMRSYWLLQEDKDFCRFPIFDGFPVPSVYQRGCCYTVMGLTACCIALGFAYRLVLCVHFVLHFWLLLADKNAWNNHSYLFGVLVFLLIWLPANSRLSLDSVFTGNGTLIPRWSYFILQAQVGIVYFIAGLKKLDPEWLEGRQLKSMSYHWVFAPTRLVVSLETINWLIHYSGCFVDLLAAPLLLWSRTRILGIIVTSSFHLMNAQIFNIGVFPYLMLATNLLFILEPKRTFVSDNKSSLPAIFCGLWLLVQCTLPYAHHITRGVASWQGGQYGYEWNMMIMEWRQVHRIVRVHDRISGEEYFIDPSTFVSSESRIDRHPGMAQQYAKCLAYRLSMEEYGLDRSSEFGIYIDMWMSVNGRFIQRAINSSVDLVAAEWSLWRTPSYYIPLLLQLSDWRSRLDDIKTEFAERNSTHDGIELFADFPGMKLTNFIEADLGNVTLTSLTGSSVIEISGVNVTLAPGDMINIPSGEFHYLYTLPPNPAGYVYRFTNKTIVQLEGLEKDLATCTAGGFRDEKSCLRSINDPEFANFVADKRLEDTAQEDDETFDFDRHVWKTVRDMRLRLEYSLSWSHEILTDAFISLKQRINL